MTLKSGGTKEKEVLDVAAGVTEAVGEGKDLQARNPSRGTRKLRTAEADGIDEQRFFLAKPGGSHGVPEFSKEFPGEAQAMVESLKTGLSYFVVSEWRGVADFSGRKPQLGREAVHGASKAV
jgi:hypothetical protein